jgi:hypothetical protein
LLGIIDDSDNALSPGAFCYSLVVLLNESGAIFDRDLQAWLLRIIIISGLQGDPEQAQILNQRLQLSNEGRSGNCGNLCPD